MSCPYYWWNHNYACRKSKKDVDEDTYYKYCRNYDYDDCPKPTTLEDGLLVCCVIHLILLRVSIRYFPLCAEKPITALTVAYRNHFHKPNL